MLHGTGVSGDCCCWVTGCWVFESEIHPGKKPKKNTHISLGSCWKENTGLTRNHAYNNIPWYLDGIMPGLLIKNKKQLGKEPPEFLASLREFRYSWGTIRQEDHDPILPHRIHVWYLYLDLPKGAKWLLKGVNSTSLRVLLAPLGRCWYWPTFSWYGKCRILWPVLWVLGDSFSLAVPTPVLFGSLASSLG